MLDVDNPTRCESVRKSNCVNVAAFRYVPTNEYTRDHGPLDMCADCAYELMNDVGQSNFVPIRVRKQTVHCRECGSIVRVEPIGINVSPSYRHCVTCGSDNVLTGFNVVTDYWDLLAQTLGIPRGIIQTLHAAWNPAEGQSFKQFVDGLRQEIRNERDTKSR